MVYQKIPNAPFLEWKFMKFDTKTFRVWDKNLLVFVNDILLDQYGNIYNVDQGTITRILDDKYVPQLSTFQYDSEGFLMFVGDIVNIHNKEYLIINHKGVHYEIIGNFLNTFGSYSIPYGAKVVDHIYSYKRQELLRNIQENENEIQKITPKS